MSSTYIKRAIPAELLSGNVGSGDGSSPTIDTVVGLRCKRQSQSPLKIDRILPNAAYNLAVGLPGVAVAILLP